MTRYELAKLSGVSQAALSRFCAAERGMTTDSVDRLAAVAVLLRSLSGYAYSQRGPRRQMVGH